MKNGLGLKPKQSQDQDLKPVGDAVGPVALEREVVLRVGSLGILKISTLVRGGFLIRRKL